MLAPNKQPTRTLKQGKSMVQATAQRRSHGKFAGTRESTEAAGRRAGPESLRELRESTETVDRL